MNTEIVTRLDTMASVRLFGAGKWLVDQEATIALGRALTAMGLQEQVSEDTARITALGTAVSVDLYLCFLGAIDPPDMIGILAEYRLLRPGEAAHLFDLLERGEQRYELALKARIQQAYRDFHKPVLTLIDGGTQLRDNDA